MHLAAVTWNTAALLLKIMCKENVFLKEVLAKNKYYRVPTKTEWINWKIIGLSKGKNNVLN